MKNIIITTLVSAMITGCAGTSSISKPQTYNNKSNSIVINKPIDTLWKTSVASLSKQFFIINNLDKVSGLINVSYSGDPEKYIDCGRINTYVKNARGERTYDFPASRAQQTFETYEGANLLFYNRKMSLEGRMNLVFEDLGNSTTKITANTKYIVTKSLRVRDVQGKFQDSIDVITFGTGQSASFPGNEKGEVTCTSTGALEEEVLSLIKN